MTRPQLKTLYNDLSGTPHRLLLLASLTRFLFLLFAFSLPLRTAFPSLILATSVPLLLLWFIFLHLYQISERSWEESSRLECCMGFLSRLCVMMDAFFFCIGAVDWERDWLGSGPVTDDLWHLIGVLAVVEEVWRRALGGGESNVEGYGEEVEEEIKLRVEVEKAAADMV